jgi:hypothetical protein
VDNALRRLSKYSPELEYTASFPLPGDPFDVEALADGRLLVNMDLRTSDAAGLPLHFVDPHGAVVRSFGSENPVYRRDMPGLTRRSLAVRSDGSFWAVGFSDYSIELWTADGTLRRRWLRDADWFEPHPGRAAVRRGEAPKPVIVDIREDARGLLWTMIWIADPEWEAAIAQGGSIQGQQRLTTTSADAYLDTRIEVIDLQNNRLLLSKTIPQALHSFVGQDQAAAYRETEDGAFIDIYRMTLEVPTRRN